MKRVDRAELIWMQHRKLECRVAAKKIASDPAARRCSQRTKLRVDEWHELIDDQVLPLTSHWRVAIERPDVRRGEVTHHQDEVANLAVGDRAIEQALHSAILEH